MSSDSTVLGGIIRATAALATESVASPLHLGVRGCLEPQDGVEVRLHSFMDAGGLNRMGWRSG